MSLLRVATLNIWNTQGPWDERRPVLTEQLRHINAEIVGLQEVLRLSAGGAEMLQVGDIATALGYEVVFGPAKELGPGLQFGNAVFSKYPILASEVFRLPDGGTDENRALLYALIDSPIGRVPFFVTHLNWKLHEANVRIEQVHAIVEHVDRLAPEGTRTLPAVLVGDFNAEPDSDEIRFLKGFHVSNGKSTFFADAWHWSGDGSPGYTFDRRNPFAAISHEPPRRIDYIFKRGLDAQHRLEPVRTEVVFDTAINGVFASDHFGLVSELELSDEP